MVLLVIGHYGVLEGSQKIQEMVLIIKDHYVFCPVCLLFYLVLEVSFLDSFLLFVFFLPQKVLSPPLLLRYFLFFYFWLILIISIL